MAVRGYRNFDVVIGPDGDDGWDVHIVDSPAGEARGSFVDPFEAHEVENFILKMGARRGVRRAAAPVRTAAQDFGSRLYRAVFRDDVDFALRQSIQHAREHDEGLRIRLRLADAGALGDLPWEYLHSEHLGRPLALSLDTPLVRYTDLGQAPEPLEVDLPLRILVVMPSPDDVEALDTQREVDNLREAVADLVAAGRVEVHALERSTVADLQHHLRRDSFHILHFMGHGVFDEQSGQGMLAFEDARGAARPIPGSALGMLLHDHRALQLVVLNACEGARSSVADPVGGVAQALVHQGIPAVVAMQFEISDRAAKVFSRELYLAVADGLPVDAAVSEARKALYLRDPGAEWGTPVLHLRAPDGVIFDVHESDTVVPVAGQAEAGPQLPDVSELLALAEEASAKGGDLAGKVTAIGILQRVLAIDPGNEAAAAELRDLQASVRLDPDDRARDGDQAGLRGSAPVAPMPPPPAPPAVGDVDGEPGATPGVEPGAPSPDEAHDSVPADGQDAPMGDVVDEPVGAESGPSQAVVDEPVDLPRHDRDAEVVEPDRRDDDVASGAPDETDELPAVAEPGVGLGSDDTAATGALWEAPAVAAGTARPRPPDETARVAAADEAPVPAWAPTPVPSDSRPSKAPAADASGPTDGTRTRFGSIGRLVGGAVAAVFLGGVVVGALQGLGIMDDPDAGTADATAAEVPDDPQVVDPAWLDDLGATTYVAMEAGTPPTIDADLSDWGEVVPIDMPHPVAGASPRTSARGQVAWDAATLYVGATVQDPGLVQLWRDNPAQLWRGDSVSFEWTPFPADDLDVKVGAGDLHVLLGPDGGNGTLAAINPARNGVFGAGAEFDRIDVASRRTGDGWVLEAAVPWDLLDAAPPDAGMVAGFNLNLSDAQDGGGGLHSMISSTAGRTSANQPRPACWGLLLLWTGAQETPPDGVLEDATPVTTC